MRRLIADIRREIAERPARSAWDKGCREYAVELFDEVVDHRKLTDSDELGKEITEKEQLNGASDWSQYSFGGCALVYDGDICERLCTPKEAERLKYGERKPPLHDSWLDAQAAALKQAARIVRLTANRKTRPIQTAPTAQLPKHVFVAKRMYAGDKTLIIFANDLIEAEKKAQKAFGLGKVFVDHLVQASCTDDPEVFEI